MKLSSQKPNANRAALLAGLLLAPAGLQAAQLAYEGFDYSTGSGNLTGQNGGSGWNGAWQTVNNGSADVVTGSLAASASAPTGYDLRSIGNSSNLPTNRRTGRFLNTSTNGPFGSRGYRNGNGQIGADGTTLYLSFMQQPNGTSSYYEFEFHRGNLGDGGRIGGIGNDQGAATNVFLRAPNGTHTALPGAGGTTAVNFYVVRIDFKAGNDDVYVYRNPTSATDPGLGAATLTKLAVADMSFDGVSFGAFNNSRTVAHDEVRFGQTWDDVTLPVNAQPAFVSQPQTTTTTFAGGTFGLTAVANGYPEPTYQWFKGVDPVAGQTSSTLYLTNVQPGDAGAYHLVATNSQGTATTNNAQLVVNPVPAGLLAYEGFDYNTGTSNVNGKAGGLGWGAPWVAVDGGGGNSFAGSLAAGTNAPNGYDAQSLGNSDFMPNAKRDGRLVDTTPGGRLGAAGYIDLNGNVGADGKTLYLSFLQQPDGTSLFYEFEFHKGNLGDPGRIGGIGNDTANPVVNLRTPTNTPTFIGPGSTGVNFYVVRIDYKAGSDEVRIYQNPLSATEPGTPTLLKTDGGDMSFNGISLAAFVGTRTVKHDEIRLGQNWSDVVFGTSRRELTWVGDNISNNWNFSTANWNDGIGATQFAAGDPVTFSDTGSDTPAVNIPATVSTALVTVTNSTKNYTLGGVGAINSSGGLAKSGTGSLTLSAPASFGAGVTMNDGSLVLNSTASFGGNLTQTTGNLTLSGNNTFTGRLIASSGTHTLSGTNSVTGLQSTNANFTITGPMSVTGTSSPVYIGNLAGANSSLTIETGGSLAITGNLSDAWVIGRDGGSGSVTQNGGTVTYNPINHPETFIGASATGGTVASYDMNGGVIDMSNTRLGVALGPITAHLNQTGGTINVRHLELGPNLMTGTGIYNLTGGRINIGAVGLGTSGITSFSGLYQINLKGGTVGALADWQSPLSMKLISPITFDSNGKTVTLSGGLTDFDDTHTTPGSLVKTGAGTLVIGGFNDFTGPITVNGGTLAGNGNQLSNVTVASGAAISPGVGGTGSFSTNTATFQSGSTLQVQINSTTGTANQLVAFGNVNITGATASFAEVGAGTILAGTELLILDRTGVSLTGTFAGYPQGASVSVGSNTFTLSYTSPAGITLTSTTVENPYNAWAASKGLDGSPGKETAFNADPENDGIANGLEWILGGNPLASDASSLVTVTGNATSGLTLAFNREEASLVSATLVAQWNSNLGTWTDVPVTQAGGSYPNGVTVTVNEAATPDAVTVQIPASNAANGKLFGRLRATMP